MRKILLLLAITIASLPVGAQTIFTPKAGVTYVDINNVEGVNANPGLMLGASMSQVGEDAIVGMSYNLEFYRYSYSSDRYSIGSEDYSFDFSGNYVGVGLMVDFHVNEIFEINAGFNAHLRVSESITGNAAVLEVLQEDHILADGHSNIVTGVALNLGDDRNVKVFLHALIGMDELAFEEGAIGGVVGVGYRIN